MHLYFSMQFESSSYNISNNASLSDETISQKDWPIDGHRKRLELILLSSPFIFDKINFNYKKYYMHNYI